jgi:flagellar biosynthesis protein FlhG
MRDQAWKLRSLLAESPVRLNGGGRVLAVTSGKGGVGKTNVSVGLALSAARSGLSTVLIDGDLGLANIDVLLDLHSEKNLGHLVEGEAQLREVLVTGPEGLRILPGASGLTQVADMGHTRQQRLLDAMGELVHSHELVIIDTGAGISKSVIDLCKAAGEVLVVTTPEPTAVVDAYAMLKVFSCDVPTPKCWLTINQAQSRGEAQQVASRITALANKFLSLEVQNAGSVLFDPRVSASVRKRQHFTRAYPASPASRSIRELAGTLGVQKAQKSKGGFLNRLKEVFVGDIGGA